MRTKVITLLACVLLVGCATQPKPTPQSALNQEDYQPDNEPQYLLQDDTFTTTSQEDTDQDRYEASLDKINDTFQREYTEYSYCLALNSNHKGCFELLTTKLCQVDMLLDSHSDHHLKPYCSQAFLKEQKKIK